MQKTNLPKRAYLNKLVNAGRLLPDPQTGLWLGDPGAANFLSNLVHDIDVGGTLDDPRQAHSVPSVYARPILFAQALIDPFSPLHGAVVKEWRGMMAVLALQSWIGYSVGFVNYGVAPTSPNAASFVGKVPLDDLHLRTMLHSLLPQPQAFWNPLRLIYVNNVLIGAASPWTMVFTPAGTIAESSVPWANGKVLLDPIDLYGRNGGLSLELTILHQWIDHLIVAGNDPLNPNWGMNAVGGSFLAAIGRELTCWKADLAPFVDPAWDVPGLNPVNAISGPYQYALRAAQPPMRVAIPGGAAVAAPEQSDLFLWASKPGVSNVVALKRSGLPVRSRVHNGAFVEDIDIEHLPGSSGASLQTKGGVVHGVNWVMAEEVFFPPKIARVSLAEAALNCGPGLASDYSLPITTAFLKYFTHADVSAGRLQVAVTGTGANSLVTATLGLPLQGGTTLSLQKQYDPVNDIAGAGTGMLTPAFGLWPDFVSEEWTHNFASYVGPCALGEHAFTVKPLLLDGTTGVSTKVDGMEKELRIWRCTSPPIGFALASDGDESGMLLRKWLNKPLDRVTGIKWIISVDFGTANTMISCRSEGSDHSTVLTLQSRLLPLNNGADANMWKLGNGLYPLEGAIPPFRTLLYKLEATPFGMQQAAYSLRFEFLGADVANLVRDLKWGSDTAPMRAYLDGLVRYIACEAHAAGIADLVFKWSYPLALPDASRLAMSSFWAAITGNYKVPAITVGHPLKDGKDGKVQRHEESVSESEATCRALAWHEDTLVPVKSSGLCIAIDVGGGSTDFAYWSDGDLLDQFSFKLAGNDVLCGQWLNKGEMTGLPGFLEGIIWASTGTTPTKEQLDAYVNMEGNQVEVLINHILSQAIDGDRIRFSGPNPLSHPAVGRIFQGGHTSTPWFQIRTAALLLFGGISYYAGLHARAFAKDIASKDDITLCFGGRGANLLTWLWNGPLQLKAALSSFFTFGYGNGLGVSEPLSGANLMVKIVGAPVGQWNRFPGLKEEVAQGMLRRPIGSANPAGDPYVGEVDWRQASNPNPVAWDRRLSGELISALVRPANADRCYITHFLNTVIGETNPEVRKLGIDLPGIRPDTLRIDWADIESRMKMDIVGTGVSQPLFAIELKSLMSTYISQSKHSAAAPLGH